VASCHWAGVEAGLSGRYQFCDSIEDLPLKEAATILPKIGGVRVKLAQHPRHKGIKKEIGR